MQILHAAWLPQTDTAPARLALWGEAARGAFPRRKSRVSTRLTLHPFTATTDELTSALPLADLEAEPVTLVARLPTVGDEPQPSGPFLRENSAEGKPALRAWRVTALAFAAREALALLVNFAEEAPLGADARFWQAAARLALDLLVRQRYLPALVKSGERWLARWRPLLDSQEEQALLERLVKALPPAARAVTRTEKASEPGPRALLTDFLQVTVDAAARASADFGTRPRRAAARLAPGERWLAALASADPALDLPDDFIQRYQAWSQPAESAGGNLRLCFRLDPPETKSAADLYIPKARASDWTLGYFLQASDDPSLLVPAETVWRERGSTLKYLNRRFDQPQERLLAGLGLAARIFAPIEASLTHARPEACAITADEAHAFIREAALLLQASGFGVLLPGLSTKLGLRLKLSGKPHTTKKGPQGGVARLSFESVVAFDWELALGDQPLSRAEFEKLAALKVPLVQIRGQWVEVRPEQLQQALAFLEKREQAGEIPAGEALRMALAPASVGGLPVTGVETSGWFGEFVEQFTHRARLKPLPAPKGLTGTLRHYQATGFAWLVFLRQFGLGACLADDMGLGKTIQAIALLLHLRAHGNTKPALLVCPTSVVGNWQHELAHFAPSLKVLVHHGGEREKRDFARQATRHEVVLTTYALLHRDKKLLGEVKWGEVVLDEAQNIKNPQTRQATAARGLPAEHRLALTGTPVENRLAELWSIFQFLNPGYLGSQESFRANFARPIERAQDPEAARRLKGLVGPFVLRRVKTDPNVIRDLPAKNEMKVYCTLTREQATLYQAVVRDSLRQIEESEGLQRRGLVLATLTKLKQVCNHPAHLLGDGSPLPDRSGKLNRLAEMLEEVRAVKEHALIFTQFAEMGQLLKAHLQNTFGDEVLFLHGGTPAQARTAMVERFQSDPHAPPAFVLSIKAGGTGLNLTRANHVFHFDRWWNPAVENQATDRAFRIGQTKNVQVHKFLCAGTVEERVDEMITRKLALAESIVGTSEGWITELSTEQLRELFTLRAEAVG
ncbi:MAG: DEAD/DEAH box helicase [Chloroflexi bacterium]|nr:DEAD/DEAH box helicase [Chloroflexota bacterium]